MENTIRDNTELSGPLLLPTKKLRTAKVGQVIRFRSGDEYLVDKNGSLRRKYPKKKKKGK